MKKLIIKIIISIILQFSCFYIIACFGVWTERNPISHGLIFIVVLLFILLLQLLLIALYKIKPLHQKKHKKIYWVLNCCCTFVTAYFWLIMCLLPLLVEDILERQL